MGRAGFMGPYKAIWAVQDMMGLKPKTKYMGCTGLNLDKLSLKDPQIGNMCRTGLDRPYRPTIATTKYVGCSGLDMEKIGCTELDRLHRPTIDYMGHNCSLLGSIAIIDPK